MHQNVSEKKKTCIFYRMVAMTEWSCLHQTTYNVIDLAFAEKTDQTKVPNSTIYAKQYCNDFLPFTKLLNLYSIFYFLSLQFSHKISKL